MKAKELLRLLHKNGWEVKAQKGSHIQLVHPTIKGKITVPFHSGDVKKSILNLILKQSGLK